MHVRTVTCTCATWRVWRVILFLVRFYSPRRSIFTLCNHPKRHHLLAFPLPRTIDSARDKQTRTHARTHTSAHTRNVQCTSSTYLEHSPIGSCSVAHHCLKQRCLLPASPSCPPHTCIAFCLPVSRCPLTRPLMD